MFTAITIDRRKCLLQLILEVTFLLLTGILSARVTPQVLSQVFHPEFLGSPISSLVSLRCTSRQMPLQKFKQSYYFLVYIN